MDPRGVSWTVLLVASSVIAGIGCGSSDGSGGASPATCGKVGEECCAGDLCGTGLTCKSGTCQDGAVCGALSQACCTTGDPCGAGLTCNGGTCQQGAACGALNEACCTTGDPCGAGMSCTSGKCGIATTGSITGTITLYPGVNADLRNGRVAVYRSLDDCDFDREIQNRNVAATGTEMQVSFTISDLTPGIYYLDYWKDLDNDNLFDTGDLWSRCVGPESVAAGEIVYPQFQVIFIP